MRLPSHFENRRKPPDVAMTPMIDVVFLLLIFFVWTASFQIVENVLPGGVAEVVSSGEQARERPVETEIQPLKVTLSRSSGRTVWAVDGVPVDGLPQVRATMAAVYEIKPDIAVIVHPLGETPLGDVIDVYDLAREVGFSEVQFAASDR